MNKPEYNQKVLRNIEDIKRYAEIVETAGEKLSAAHSERLRLYHEG